MKQTGDSMKIGLCGNIALDHLARELDDADAASDIIVGRTGDFESELSAPRGEFTTLDACVVVLDWRGFTPGLYSYCYGDDRKAAAAAFGAACDGLEKAVRNFRSATPARLLVFSPVSAWTSPAGFISRLLEPSPQELFCECQARFNRMCRSVADVYPVDIDELMMQMGANNSFDSAARYAQDNPFTKDMTRCIARRILAIMVQFRKYPLKCLVLDCDDTLWGGVVGEAGMDNLVLSDRGPGKAFHDFQAQIARLYKQGVILAVCSKNNTCDALEVLERHPHMLIRPNMISSFRINWDDKPKNVLAISEELNIGLDAIMFADDNPAERAMMRAALPEVEILDLPAAPALYADALARCTRFWPVQLTHDDAGKGAFFTAERRRKQARELAASIEAYLVTSEISAAIAAAGGESLPRITQLFNKTNQFNLTTRRYTQAQLEMLAADSRNRLFSMAMSDRFGEYGIVAAALVLGNTVDSFLLSCRVFGKRAETAFLVWILGFLKQAGYIEAFARYVPSPKNSMTKDLYKSMGFVPVSESASESLWQYNLTNDLPEMPRWICVKEELKV